MDSSRLGTRRRLGHAAINTTHPACKKLEWWGTGVVICLERDADVGLRTTTQRRHSLQKYQHVSNLHMTHCVRI